jgi:hypothetical protein
MGSNVVGEADGEAGTLEEVFHEQALKIIAMLNKQRGILPTLFFMFPP